MRHYFPRVDLEIISDEDFAILSEDALWLHEQMLISRMPIPGLTTRKDSLTNRCKP